MTIHEKFDSIHIHFIDIIIHKFDLSERVKTHAQSLKLNFKDTCVKIEYAWPSTNFGHSFIDLHCRSKLRWLLLTERYTSSTRLLYQLQSMKMRRSGR